MTITIGWKQITYLVATVVSTLLFVIFATITLSDLRQNMGGLVATKSSRIEVGEIYDITDGRMGAAIPVCGPTPGLLAKYTKTDFVRYGLSNNLGKAVPIVTRWFGTGELLGKELVAGSLFKVEVLSTTRFRDEGALDSYLLELYAEKPWCEQKMLTYWKKERCLAVATLVKHIPDVNQTVGFSYNQNCIVPDVQVAHLIPGMDADDIRRIPTVPGEPGENLLDKFSAIKEYMGVISNSI